MSEEQKNKKEVLEKHKKEAKQRKLNNYNLWQYATAILAVLLVISVATNYGSVETPTGGAVMSAEEAATKTISYVNENLLQPPMEATLVSVAEENGMYNVIISIGEQEIPTYITKNGKLFFPQAMNLDENLQIPTQQQQPPADVPKSDKPKIELFVMSHCPFGLMAERGMLPVAKLLSDKIDFSIKFVDYAMHGETEVYEQLNQYCIQTEQNDKFFDYLECFLEAGDGEACLAEAGIDTKKLEKCTARVDEEFDITANLEDMSTWSGGRFPPFNIHTDLCQQYGVRGSPSLVINGQSADSGRDPASYLSTICSAFNVEPEECGETLSTASPSSGFGGGTSDGSGADAQCG